MYLLKNKKTGDQARFDDFKNAVTYKRIILEVNPNVEFTFQDTEIKDVKKKKVDKKPVKRITGEKRRKVNNNKTNLPKAKVETVEPFYLHVPMAQAIKNWAEVSVALDKIKTTFKNGGGDKKG